MTNQDTIKQLASDLLAKMGVNGEVEVVPEGDGYKVQIESATESSLLIGRHGAGLRAIQAIIDAAAFKALGKKVEIIVDIGDYRQKQQERLQEIAREAAERVMSENQPARLHSFSGYERKIIHEYISENFPKLTSVSEGEEERVLIISKKNNN